MPLTLYQSSPSYKYKWKLNQIEIFSPYTIYTRIKSLQRYVNLIRFNISKIIKTLVKINKLKFLAVLIRSLNYFLIYYQITIILNVNFRDFLTVSKRCILGNQASQNTPREILCRDNFWTIFLPDHTVRKRDLVSGMSEKIIDIEGYFLVDINITLRAIAEKSAAKRYFSKELKQDVIIIICLQ